MTCCYDNIILPHSSKYECWHNHEILFNTFFRVHTGKSVYCKIQGLFNDYPTVFKDYKFMVYILKFNFTNAD